MILVLIDYEVCDENDSHDIEDTLFPMIYLGIFFKGDNISGTKTLPNSVET